MYYKITKVTVTVITQYEYGILNTRIQDEAEQSFMLLLWNKSNGFRLYFYYQRLSLYKIVTYFLGFFLRWY